MLFFERINILGLSKEEVPAIVRFAPQLRNFQLKMENEYTVSHLLLEQIEACFYSDSKSFKNEI